MDIRTKCTPEQLNHFWWRVWPEAVRSFSHAGIQFQCTDVKGEIKISPGDRPIFVGLERGFINLMLTDRLPMAWDKARSLAGMTTLYEGYHLSVIAIGYAHGYQVPFLSTNTCVHELLHLLLQDVFLKARNGIKSTSVKRGPTGTPPAYGCSTIARRSANRPERTSRVSPARDTFSLKGSLQAAITFAVPSNSAPPLTRPRAECPAPESRERTLHPTR
jgi:hypothetical protein